ncbi:Bug family tripartite tricarboxylate transporter substrate binding protein [Falsiroseomonas oryziterrae]|uniref:Bug family tripartite tricarboxylate transporter substrate binding protein n=1 Tax=Falsiroseomonas oryziterrae TaxID=2911368 RepID=UPI001F3D7449|nr:tripartite tricarboxylate transporter substrate-binding protein [Roseomonas sp. NPKOSM-4]
MCTTLTRRGFGAALGGMLAGPALAQAPAWPNRPIRLISPFAPGGPQDVPARFFVDHLTPRLGQPVVYESRAGAGGALGMQHVAQATDGHSFLITSNAIASLPALRRDLAFDPLTELLPVTLVNESPLVIAVRANGPASLADYLARARSTPGRLSFGSSGVGSATHLAGALLMQRAGIELLHVPYRGAGHLVAALMSGDVDSFIGDISLTLEHVRAGTMRVLAVTTAERAPALPEVPALREQVTGYVVPFWFGLFAGKATPPEAIRRVLAELAPLAAPDSELSRRMAERGSQLLLTGPEPLAARLRAEVPQWREVVSRGNITPE